MDRGARKISDKQRKSIEELDNHGLSCAEISRRVELNYNRVYNIIGLKYLTNSETGERFNSWSEYNGYLVKQTINPETGEKFKSQSEYNEYLAKQRINPKTGEKFKSQSEYQRYLAKQSQKRPENKKLSELINKRLNELGKNKSWLAEQLNVQRKTVSKYANGKHIPRVERLERLFSVLEVPYKTLYDLLENTK